VQKSFSLGIVKALIEKTQVKVHALYRSDKRSSGLFEYHKKNSDRVVLHLCDPNSEDSLIEVSKNLNSIDFIINSIGLLHDSNKGIKPERKIEDCEFQKLIELYKVNTLISVSIYKVFKDFFKKRSPTLFSTVSAKVGSVSENALGGWYGYRMSKAALNAGLKSLSGVNIINVLDDTLTGKDAHFLSWDGKTISW